MQQQQKVLLLPTVTSVYTTVGVTICMNPLCLRNNYNCVMPLYYTCVLTCILTQLLKWHYYKYLEVGFVCGQPKLFRIQALATLVRWGCSSLTF